MSLWKCPFKRQLWIYSCEEEFLFHWKDWRKIIQASSDEANAAEQSWHYLSGEQIYISPQQKNEGKNNIEKNCWNQTRMHICWSTVVTTHSIWILFLFLSSKNMSFCICSIQILVNEEQQFRNHKAQCISKMHILTFQFCSECVETCTPITLASCFLLLRVRLDLDVLVFVECLVVWSCVPSSSFSLIGSWGGASGHGVRFDGTVMSRGGSIIHLHEIASNSQGYAHMHRKHGNLKF